MNIRASGLGRDPMTGCIAASDEWWQEQNVAMPGCIVFKTSPLEHEDEIGIVFESISYTNEIPFVPRGTTTTENLPAYDAGKEGEDGGDNSTPSPSVGNKIHAAIGGSGPSPNLKKGKKTYKDGLMKCLVDAYEKKN